MFEHIPFELQRVSHQAGSFHILPIEVIPFRELNCENQPHALALGDANLRHLNVRICEQGIGAGAREFPIVAHGPRRPIHTAPRLLKRGPPTE
jgi:hypothetical protein